MDLASNTQPLEPHDVVDGIVAEVWILNVLFKTEFSKKNTPFKLIYISSIYHTHTKLFFLLYIGNPFFKKIESS